MVLAGMNSATPHVLRRACRGAGAVVRLVVRHLSRPFQRHRCTRLVADASTLPGGFVGGNQHVDETSRSRSGVAQTASTTARLLARDVSADGAGTDGEG